MKKPKINFSKEKLKDFANATRNAVNMVSENVKSSSEQLASYLDKTRFANDRKRLCPFYAENLNAEGYSLPLAELYMK